MKNIAFRVFFVCLIIFAGFALMNGTFLKQSYRSVWNNAYNRSLDSDLQRITASALKSSSIFNMQPWRVKFVSDTNVELYLDKDKSIADIDKDYNNSLISQGAFIENFIVNAEEIGYKTKVSYFKDSIDSKTYPIASIKITRFSTANYLDSLAGGTYKTTEDDKDNIAANLKYILESYSNLDFKIINDELEVNKFKLNLLLAKENETSNKNLMEELLNNYRYTEWEKNENKYGLSTIDKGIFLSTFYQPITKFKTKNSFNEYFLNKYKDLLEKEKAYIIITTNSLNQEELINTGKGLQSLINNTTGYSLRPATQILDDIEDNLLIKNQVEKELTNMESIVMIIGVSDVNTAKSNSIRHTVEEIIIK